MTFLPPSSLVAVSEMTPGFYETAGAVKVFVFAFVFSLVALLFLLLLLPFLVSCIHLGLLSALFVNPFLDSVHIGVR
jgi:hypothetical protein